MCGTPEVPQKRLEKGPDPNICLLGTERWSSTGAASHLSGPFI